MKITIEPSDEPGARNYPAIIYDTRTNEELTDDCFTAAIVALQAAGHDMGNLVEAAQEFVALKGKV